MAGEDYSSRSDFVTFPCDTMLFPMSLRSWAGLAALIGILGEMGAQAVPSEDGAGLPGLVEAADQWLDLEVRAARDLEAWKAEQQILENTRMFLRQEGDNLRRRIDNLESAARVYQGRQEQVAVKVREQEAALALAEERLAALEEQYRAFTLRLPPPLQEQVRDLTRNLGASAQGLGTRVQNLVSLVMQIDQFNNGLTLSHQIRDIPGVGPLDVKVLYWGLAIGYGVDAEGERAWVVRPSAQGWVWEDRPDRAEAIRTLFAVYEKKAPPALVAAPAPDRDKDL